jgi:hypothetical protein
MMRLGRQTLAAARAAPGDDLPSSLSGHAGAKTMAALAPDFAWLVCAYHGRDSSFSCMPYILIEIERFD